MEQQDQILEMIRSRKIVKSREIIRECQGWDFRKAISRLRRMGYPIVNVAPPGKEAMYIWAEKDQLPLI